jgi:glycosyltransferase involved in cell wall biosynthesis
MMLELFKRLPLARDLLRYVAMTYEELDYAKSRMDVSDELFDEYQAHRATPAYMSVYEKESPLVSVCVATYNRANLLVERSLKSLLAQSYQNLEIIVVGDACTDDTASVVSSIADARVRFFNLPERGIYPIDPMWRWMVAGTAPINRALEMSSGDFITHLDDDDEFSPDRVQRLLDFIKAERADIVWHPFYRELPNGRWMLRKTPDFSRNQVTTSSVFYHAWFRKIPWDINAYRYREPGDWNRFRKFKYLGAKAAYFPEPMLRHYRERSQGS